MVFKMNTSQEFILFDCGRKEEVIVKNFSHIINNKEFKNDKTEILNIEIGNNLYNLNILMEDVDFVMRLVQVEWIELQGTTIAGFPLSLQEVNLTRQVINKYLGAIETSLILCNNSLQRKRYNKMLTKSLEDFLDFCIPFCELEDDLLLKVTAVNKISKCPLYHYLHTALEIQYHSLILYVICEASVLEQHVENIMKGLIMLSLKNYKRQHDQIFVCSCIKYFWLIIQFIIEKTNSNHKEFWTIFNRLVANEEPSFCIFLLKELASLQCISSELINEGVSCGRISTNYEFLENKLKIFLTKAQSNDLLQLLKLLKSLLIKVWIKNGRIDIYQIIWDYYSKRLNISNKNYINLNAVEFSKIIDTIIYNPDHDFTEDFELFVSILISHLKEYPTQWGKLKGRIYSQLGRNKLKDLNETGTTRLILLFICLSHLYCEEGVKKNLSICEILLEEKSYPVIWSVYTSFIIQQVKENKSLEKTGPLMLKLLQKAMEDSQKFYLINAFFINFKYILNTNSRMDLHQWVFFSIRLDKYFLTCYYADLNTALEVIVLLLDKVSISDCWPLWESVLTDYIYPALKKLSTTQNAPKILGNIFGILYFRFTDLNSDIFNLLTSENVPSIVSAEFLNVLLEDYPNKCTVVPQQIPPILQTWIRDCLLSNNSCKQLTSSVLNLDIFPPLLKSHIASSDNPLFAFIEYIGSDIQEHLHSSKIISLCEIVFNQIDKWLIPYLVHPDDESTVLHIYNFIALAFLHCGLILYNSKKQSSPVTNLVQAMLLPTDFLIGKPHHVFVLNGVKRTWAVFFEAFVNLNVNCDMYLERTLRDMITKYVPCFPTVDSPMLKCFDKTSTAVVFLEKVSSCYFKNPIKESDTNIVKIAKILKSFIESNTSVEHMKIIVKGLLYGLLEAVIFYTQRNVPISLIRSLTNSPLYSETSNEFCDTIVVIIDKHLALNTINSFQLMFILASFIPADMKKILNIIKQKVGNVERLRGVGFDKNLRMQLEKLENIVKDSIKSS